MNDLARWLGEQLDEDERIARGATDGPWTPWRGARLHGLGDLIHPVLTPGQKPGAKAAIVTESWLDADHIAEWDPARVLREIDAKRDLLRFAEGIYDHHETFTTGVAARLEKTLRLFALPYADRPGYEESWRP
jgi:hypothetical protein